MVRVQVMGLTGGWRQLRAVGLGLTGSWQLLRAATMVGVLVVGLMGGSADHGGLQSVCILAASFWVVLHQRRAQYSLQMHIQLSNLVGNHNHSRTLGFHPFQCPLLQPVRTQCSHHA